MGRDEMSCRFGHKWHYRMDYMSIVSGPTKVSSARRFCERCNLMQAFTRWTELPPLPRFIQWVSHSLGFNLPNKVQSYFRVKEYTGWV